MTAPDPIALAAEARRLAESATPAEDTTHSVMCKCAECVAAWARGARCVEARAALPPVALALADAVEALAGERDRWKAEHDAARRECRDTSQREHEAIAERDRLTLAYREETQGLAAVASGLAGKLDAARAERDEARDEATSHFPEGLESRKRENEALSRAEGAEADRDRWKTSAIAAEREADRIRHGVQIEGDYVCPGDLRAEQAEAVLGTVTAERDRLAARVAELETALDVERARR